MGDGAAESTGEGESGVESGTAELGSGSSLLDDGVDLGRARGRNGRRHFFWWERLKMRRELAGRREVNGGETGLLDAREARGCQGRGGEMVNGDGIGVDADAFFLWKKSTKGLTRGEKGHKNSPGNSRVSLGGRTHCQPAKPVSAGTGARSTDRAPLAPW